MATPKESLTQFDRYMRSRYPIIVIASHEETRVISEIKPVLVERKRAAYVWAITSGLNHLKTTGDPAPRQIDANMTRDPQACLRKILEYPRDNTVPPTVFILKDLHNFVSRDPVVQRLLRDLVEYFEVGQHTLVLISPSWTTPADLEKSIVVVDWPLPNTDELASILRQVESHLDKSIPNSLNGSRAAVIEAMRGLSAFEAESTILTAVISTHEFGESMIPYIVKEKRQIIRKAGILEFFDTVTTMAEVGGLDRLKQYARIKRATFTPKARDAGVEPARGVLLLGVPGVGKSLSAKAIAGGQMPLLRLDIGSVMGSLVGQSEANIRQALKTAEAVAPCVLWIDEIEKALGGSGGEQDGGTSSRVFGTILTWMQETTAPVYVVATANDVRALKPELLRRFDDIIFVDLPCHADRAAVAAIHLQRRRQDPARFDLATVADVTWGYTGAEIEKVVKSALEAAFVDGREITTDDLVYSASTIVPIGVTMRDQIANLRDWARNRAITAAMPLEDPEVKTGVRKIEL